MGALAYRLLTGEPPFRAKTPVGVLTKHLTEPVVPPSERRPELEIHPAVDELVGRALAKRPEERYESTGALLDALEAAFLQCQAGLGDTGRQHPLAGWASGMTTTPLPDDIDYGLATGLRLRRSDFDAFERGLRRRRRIGLAAVPALLLGGSALFAYRMLFSASAPLSRERESNDRLELANPIAAGSEVRGHIGKRISQSEPDRDFYRPAEPPAGNVATAQLSGLPNMDLALSLHDLSGRLLVTANEGEIGAGESIWRHRVTGPFTVQVTQVMAADPRALPVENVSDEYRLVLHLSPVDPRLESEPNDSAADALSLAAATPITGRLDRRDDVDCFRFAGAAGRYRVQLSGTPGWTVLWRLPGEKPQLPGGSAALAPGDVIEILGGQRPVARPLAERSYTLELQPQPAGP
jgi:serine/threonine-protein kinase